MFIALLKLFFPFLNFPEPEPPAKVEYPAIEFSDLDAVETLARALYDIEKREWSNPPPYDQMRAVMRQRAEMILPVMYTVVFDDFLARVDDEVLGVAPHAVISKYTKGNYNAVQGNRIRFNLVIHAFAEKYGILLKTKKLKPRGNNNV